MPNPVESAVRAVAERAVGVIAAWNRKRLPRTDSPFVVGIHAPMRAELSLEKLAMTGSIPARLNGRYLKMGANPVQPDPNAHHWFLGDGMVHGIALQDGRAVWYRNRWIRSHLAAAALGRPPAPGPRRGRNDTVNTNVVEIGGRPFALVEAGSFPVELSATLDEQRYNPFDGTLSGSFSGHPHRDPRTGEHHAIAYDGSVWDAVRHVVVSEAGKVVRDVAIPVQHGPCIHDCAITDRFAIVLDLPVTFSMRAVLGGHAFPFRWNPAHPARVGLLPRDGEPTRIVWCEMPPCFVFHVANAYDSPDGRVVLDVIAYATMFASGASGLDALGRLERWTIDPATRRIDRRVIDATPQEFPRIDERRFGQRHRYTYTVAVPPDGDPQLTGATRLYKHDLETGTRLVHDFGDGHLPGEFVFVPAAADAQEDEGWLVGLVIDVADDTTDFVVLDAQRFDAAPVARVTIPHRIPPGFHGNWFPTQRIGGCHAMSGMRRPRSRQTAMRLRMKVWDAPTRLFHLAIVLLIAISYVTAKYASGANMALLTKLHFLSGYTMLTLLLFRLAWGFVGSETSRFGQFLRNPLEGFQHLRQFGRREPDDQVGHNAAGGWMVLVLLITLAVQAVTGLFTFDDVPEGPLGGTVSESTAYWLTAVHRANFNVILVLIALHVVAVAAYAVIKRQNLVWPMITGRKRLPGATRQPRMASPLLALLLVALAGCVVWVVVTRI